MGKVFVEEFLLRGAKVVATDIREDLLYRLREETPQEYRDSLETYPLDVTREDLIEKMREEILSRGPVDILVNNAGIVYGGSFEEIPLSYHRRIYEVNVFGVVAMTYAFLPHLVSRPDSFLVQMASASGFIGLPYGSTYASSKWAVVGFSESLRLELKKRKQNSPHVVIVCPSYVDTGMFAGAKPPRGIPLLKPYSVVRRVFLAMEKRKSYVMVPWTVRITPFLKAILPYSWFDFLANRIGVYSGMKYWRGREEPLSMNRERV